ncbi:MAG: hypothetical protein CMM25_05405 [Rhodospirillaceae bacterium]|nr:hypothetical protein [Rhodospirillaceae bacterium]
MERERVYRNERDTCLTKFAAQVWETVDVDHVNNFLAENGEAWRCDISTVDDVLNEESEFHVKFRKSVFLEKSIPSLQHALAKFGGPAGFWVTIWEPRGANSGYKLVLKTLRRRQEYVD